MGTKTKWVGAFEPTNEDDTVNSGERKTLNSEIKVLEDASNTIVTIFPFKGGVMIVYTTP